MNDLNKKASSLIETQVPKFILEEHPNFVAFLKAYYEFLEDYSGGAAGYYINSTSEHQDIDKTLDEFIDHFKSELLPFFPKDLALDDAKLMKLSREFYQKKGSEEAYKFLFRILFNKDIDILYPKENILIASDAKYRLPQAIRLTLVNNPNINSNLLEKRKLIGSESKASCIVESAIRTVDKETGAEILELYISNIIRSFEAGEDVEIEYEDENGDTQIFVERLIGVISRLIINPKKRGLYYNVGDPVVLQGGLSTLPQATKARVVVGNVTTGSIESVTVEVEGYAFLTAPNSLVDVVSTTGKGANLFIASVNTSAAAINVTTYLDSIFYYQDANLAAPVFGEGGYLYEFDTATADANPGAGKIRFNNSQANLVTQIYISNTSNTPAVATNGTVSTWDTTSTYVAVANGVQHTVYTINGTITETTDYLKIPVLFSNVSASGNVTVPALGKEYTITSHSGLLDIAQINTVIGSVLTTSTESLYPLKSITVLDGGYGFRTEPLLEYDVLVDTDRSSDLGIENFTNGNTMTYVSNGSLVLTGAGWAAGVDGPSIAANNGFYNDTIVHFDDEWRKIVAYYPGNTANGMANTAILSRPFDIAPIAGSTFGWDYRTSLKKAGLIAAIEIANPGSGYAQNDNVSFTGTGVGANAYVSSVGANGEITGVTFRSRGAGYYEMPTLGIYEPGGTGAVLTAIGIADGETTDIVTSAIGRIRDFNVIYRGFDYIAAPNVSLKVQDIITTGLPIGQTITDQDFVYQGANLNASTYRANTAEFFSGNNVLRVFDYSGVPNLYANLKVGKFNSNASFNIAINTSPSITAVRTYGDGKAKATAEFLNGVIRYNGFFLNTDGFLSSDKYLQDEKKYHNFSYVVVVEKALNEYAKIIKNLIHPSGMRMIGLYTLKNEELIAPKTSSNVYSESLVSGNVSNWAQNSYAIGRATEFTVDAAPGDMMVYHSSDDVRARTRTILSIENNGWLTLDANTSFVGEGRLSSNATNAVVQVSGNSNSVSSFIAVSDELRLNVNNNSITAQVASISGNNITLNSASGITATQNNILYVVRPSYTNVNYRIISTGANTPANVAQTGMYIVKDGVPSPRFAYTRNSDKWYYGNVSTRFEKVTANVPAIHYSSGGTKLGLSLEHAATNLLLQSANLANSSVTWGGNVSFTTLTQANSIFSGQTAFVHVTDGAGSRARTQNITLSANRFYAHSIIMESVANTYRTDWGLYDTGAPTWLCLATYDWNTNTISFSQGSNTIHSWSIENYGTGPNGGSLRRLTYVTGTNANTAYGCYIYMNGVPATSNGVIIHHAQLELCGTSGLGASKFSTSPILTSTATATRAPDDFLLDDLSLLGWDSTKGTLFVETSLPSGNNLSLSGPHYLAFNDTTDNETLRFSWTSVYGPWFVVNDGGVNQVAAMGASGTLDQTPKKHCYSWKVNDFAVVASGGSITQDAAGTLPTVTRMQMTANTLPGGGGVAVGSVLNAIYYPIDKSNTEMISLTT